jgi:hypothetical protein
VKQRGVGVVQVRTEPIPPYRVSPAEVEKLEAQLARPWRSYLPGISCIPGAELANDAEAIFVDWEPVVPAFQTIYDSRT